MRHEVSKICAEVWFLPRFQLGEQDGCGTRCEGCTRWDHTGERGPGARAACGAGLVRVCCDMILTGPVLSLDVRFFAEDEESGAVQQHSLSPQQRAAQLGAVVAASCGRQGAIPVPLPPSNPVVATVRSIVGQVRNNSCLALRRRPACLQVCRPTSTIRIRTCIS